MLDSLPGELLRAVFAHVCTSTPMGTGLIPLQVQNKRHLLALSTVSRKFRSCIFPRLFEVLTIKSCDEKRLWDLESYPCLAEAAIARVPNVLAAVKELRFSAPFEQKDFRGFRQTKRCQHSFTHDPSASSLDSPGSEDDLQISQEDDSTVFMLFIDERGDTGLMKLAKRIARLVSALPNDHLISFK